MTERHRVPARDGWLSIGCLVGVCAVLVVLATGCGSDDSDSAEQFPTGLLVHDEDSNNVFEFNDDGTWAYYGSYESRQDPNVTGTYSVDGNLYTEETASAYCDTPGTYAWTYEGGNLTFEASGDDECAARKSVYLGRTYAKSE